MTDPQETIDQTKIAVSYDNVLKYYTYNEDTGKVYDKKGRELVGNKHGVCARHGKMLHHIVWAVYHKEDILRKYATLITHLDGDVHNNRIDNLRQRGVRKNIPLTQELLKKYLAYDPETGIFTPLIPNEVSFHMSGTGSMYITIRLLDKNYLAHRLVWLYMYGNLPKGHIDHMYGDTKDNRLCNLREVTARQNHQNRSKPAKKNLSGLMGVCTKSATRYCAVIRIDGKSRHLGSFRTPEEAAEAYKAAKLKYHYCPAFAAKASVTTTKT